jgi:hypothetical protein
MNVRNRNHWAETFGFKAATTLGISGTPGIHSHKRRPIARLVGVLAVLSILISSTESYAGAWTQVQGRLIGNGYFGPSPIGGVVLTLYNPQLGRSTRVVSRQDGTFYFGNIPLGQYVVEVWFPNNRYPRTFRADVYRMPVCYIGTFQVDMPISMQNPQGPGGWMQTGF